MMMMMMMMTMMMMMMMMMTMMVMMMMMMMMIAVVHATCCCNQRVSLSPAAAHPSYPAHNLTRHTLHVTRLNTTHMPLAPHHASHITRHLQHRLHYTRPVYHPLCPTVREAVRVYVRLPLWVRV
jgi:hypothetical protein